MASRKKNDADLMINNQAETDPMAAHKILDQLYEMAPIGLCLTDREHRYIRINKTLADINGKTISEHLGRTVQEVIPKLAPQIISIFQQVIKSNAPILDYKIRGKTNGRNRNERIFLGDHYPIRAEGGQVIYVSTMVRDVTARERALAELKIAEAKYEDLYDNAPDMFCSVDAKTAKIIQCNQTLATALGYPKEKMIGHHISKIYHPDSEDARKRAFQQFVEKGEVQNAELQLKRKDGSKIDVILNLTSVRDKSGKILCSRSIWRDITKLKQAEGALLSEQRRYERAIQATSDGVWEWDIKSNQEYFSSRWCEIVGYAYDDPKFPHCYDSWASRIHPDDFDQVINALKAHLEKGEVYNVEYRHRHKSGAYRWQNSRGQAIFDKKGKAIRMTGCIRDITEQKQAEESRKININLKELLTQVELEKKALQDQIAANVDNLLMPTLTRLKTKASSLDKKHVSLLEQNLQEITSSYGISVSRQQYKLAPREIEICNMVKNGLTTKEIAQLLNVSYRTVETQRNRIRQKLGIANKEINLVTYLKSLQ